MYKLPLVVLVMTIAGCSTNQNQTAEQNKIFLSEIRANANTCLETVRTKPEYVSLLQYSVPAGQVATTAQLASDKILTAKEAQLASLRSDESAQCRQYHVNGVSRIRPDEAAILQETYDKYNMIAALVVARKISWGEGLRRANAAAAEGRQKALVINQQRAANMREDAYRQQQATAAFLQNVQQQQMQQQQFQHDNLMGLQQDLARIGQQNRPLQIAPFTCSRIGSFTSCQ